MLLVAVAGLCALALTPSAAAAAGTGSIEGTVTEAAGGAPIEGVEVCAWDVESGAGAGCVFTGLDGGYALTELSAGEYKVEFWPGEDELLPQLYDHEYSLAEAEPVTVQDGEVVGGIDAALEPGGEISGTVYSDASGAPLAGIEVCVVKASNGGLAGCMGTGEDGSYAFDRLPPRDYKVVFSPDFSELFGEEIEQEDDGFQTQFWDAQTTSATADTISLAAGQAVAGIDARLLSSLLTFQAQSSEGGATVTTDLPTATVPPAVPAAETKAPAPRKLCRKGLVRRKVKGKVRCLRRKHHR
jgi:hypothetical protein